MPETIRKSSYVGKRSEGVVNRVYKFKIYPTLAQITTLEEALTTQCYLYNDMLRYRKRMYQAHMFLQAMKTGGKGAAPWSFSVEDEEEEPSEGEVPGSKIKIFLWEKRVYIDDIALLAGVRVSELLKDIQVRGHQSVLEELLPAIEHSMQEMVEIQEAYAASVAAAKMVHDDNPTEDTAVTLKKVTALYQTVSRGHISLGDLKKRFITAPRQAKHPYLTKVGYGVSAATAIRLDRTYQNFFRRLKAGENPGEMRFKSPSRYRCLAYNAYGDGCHFDETETTIECSHCLGKGVFRITSKVCGVCCGAGVCGRYPCNKCGGRKTELVIPIGLRAQLGSQPLHDISPTDNAMVKRRNATLNLVPGDYTCPLCAGAGKRVSRQARVKLQHIGEIRVQKYRELPHGTVIRNLSIVRETGTEWHRSAKRYMDAFYVCLVLEFPFTPPPTTGSAIGLALGIQEFVDSNNRSYSIPGHFVAAQRHLASIQQRISSQVKGSSRRRSNIRYLASVHNEIACCRKHWHNVLAKTLTIENGVIVVQKTDWKKIAKRPAPIPAGDVFPGEPGTYAPNGATAKSRLNVKMTDASPAAAVVALQAAGERNGCTVIIERVDERCSACGKIALKSEEPTTLFECAFCGNKISHRLNKARNLLNAGGATTVQG